MRQRLTKESGDIELAVQYALKTVNQFPTGDLEKIFLFLKFARDGRRRIDKEFVNLLIKSLIKMAEENFAANEHEVYQYCVNLLKNLGVKLN